MVVVVVAIIRLQHLFPIVVLSGAYSFLTATVLVALDAVDVAMTEAAVGAGLSTVLMLGALYLTKSDKTLSLRSVVWPMLLTFGTGAAIAFGSARLPIFGDPAGPIHQHVAPYYIANALHETMVPNVVTAILASYRGYDTLGETIVIFTAGIGVLALLRGQKHRNFPEKDSGE